MFKYLILSSLLFSFVNASTTHSFYFTNKYEIASEKTLIEKKSSTNEMILPDDNSIFSDFSVNIRITKNNPKVVADSETEISESTWNPLQGFFKYKVNQAPPTKSIVERQYKMKNEKYYVLNLLTEGTDLTEFNFFELKDSDNIDNYMNNSRNIIIKGNVINGEFYILNKKYNVNFKDKFVIKFHNKKLELKYGDDENPLFK